MACSPRAGRAAGRARWPTASWLRAMAAAAGAARSPRPTTTRAHAVRLQAPRSSPPRLARLGRRAARRRAASSATTSTPPSARCAPVGRGRAHARTCWSSPRCCEARARLRLAQRRPREALADARAAAASWAALELRRRRASRLARCARPRRSWRSASATRRARWPPSSSRLAERLGAPARSPPRCARSPCARRRRRRSRRWSARGARVLGATAPAAARAHARAVRPRRGAAPARPPRGGARAAARGAAPRRPRRRRPARRARARRAARRRGAAAARGAVRAATRSRPPSGASPRSPPEGRTNRQIAQAAVRHPAHGRDAPHARVREARHHVARRARGRALARCCRGLRPVGVLPLARVCGAHWLPMGRGVATQPAVIAGALIAPDGGVAGAADRRARRGLLDRRGDRGRDRLARPAPTSRGMLGQDGNPPLYYLLLHGWMLVFGDGEAATRALSLLFALLAIPASFWAGAAVFDRRAGALAAAGAAGSAVPDVLRAGDADVLARRPAVGAGVGVLRARVRARRAAARRAGSGSGWRCCCTRTPGGCSWPRRWRSRGSCCGAAGRSPAATAPRLAIVLALLYAPWLPSVALPGRAHRGAVGGAAVAAAAAGLPGRAVRLRRAAAAGVAVFFALRRRPPVDRAVRVLAGIAIVTAVHRVGVPRRSSRRGPRATWPSCWGRCCWRWRRSSRAARAGRSSRWSASRSCG